MKKIKVTWVDAALESHNISPEEAKTVKPVSRENVGYQISGEGEENLILVFGLIYDKENHAAACDQTLIIPSSMVKEIKEIE